METEARRIHRIFFLEDNGRCRVFCDDEEKNAEFPTLTAAISHFQRQVEGIEPCAEFKVETNYSKAGSFCEATVLVGFSSATRLSDELTFEPGA